MAQPLNRAKFPTEIVDAINQFIPKVAGPDISQVALKSFSELASDWHVWKEIADRLHVKMPDKEIGEAADSAKLTIYQTAVDNYYKELNRGLLHLISKLGGEESEGLDLELHIIEELPKLEGSASLSNVAYHEEICSFIKKHKETNFMKVLLLDSASNFSLCKVLMQSGVTPPKLEDLSEYEIKPESYDAQSLAWVTLLSESVKGGEGFNLLLFEYVLKNNVIEPKGLIYLYWLVSQFLDDPNVKALKEVLASKFGREFALKDLELIAEYPPIVIEGSPPPTTF